MPDFQTFISVLTTLLVFLTGVVLSYDTIEFRHYQISSPQWAGFLFAGITFSFVAVDQILRGFIRLEEVQRRTEEEQRRVEEEQRRDEDSRRAKEDSARAEVERLEARNSRLEATERETRRTRIETRYRTAIAR